MPLIKNKTKQIRVFAGSDPKTGADFATVAIPIGQAKEVPEGLWALHKDRENVQALIGARRLLVLGGYADAPAGPAGIEPAPAPAPTKAKAKADDAELAWADKHYKKCQAEISEMTDAGALYELLAEETRPAVKSALESRIEELGA